jgi:hypothetical protein
MGYYSQVRTAHGGILTGEVMFNIQSINWVVVNEGCRQISQVKEWAEWDIF